MAGAAVEDGFFSRPCVVGVACAGRSRAVTPVSLEEAVLAFQATYDPNEEYGITDEDAANGLRAAFKQAGITVAEDAVFHEGCISTPEKIAQAERSRARYAEARAAWRSAHPEDAILQDVLNAGMTACMRSLNERLVDDAFGSNDLFRQLRAIPKAD